MNGLYFGGLFWGILISLIGFSIVLKYAFHINIPFVRIFFGIIIILFGLKLIVGSTGKAKTHNNNTLKNIHFSEECNIIFSSGTIDLTGYLEQSKLPKEISVVFGNAIVLVPDSLNLEITSTTVFGSTILPDRSYAGFGEDRYVVGKTPANPISSITTNTVFGRLEFRLIKSSKLDQNSGQDSTASSDSNTY